MPTKRFTQSAEVPKTIKTDPTKILKVTFSFRKKAPINVVKSGDTEENGTARAYPDLVVLDVRRQDEYDSGHIYGAILIPHTELDSRTDELAGHENHEIIVYCLAGSRSAIASDILDSHNFTKVYNMLGGAPPRARDDSSIKRRLRLQKVWLRFTQERPCHIRLRL